MHQSFLGTRLTGLWWNNSLSFNLIFFVSFLLRLFVCSHDFGCCLSSGGMYTCSSQTLVHLSALRCFLVVRHAFVSSSFFFYTFTQRVFFFFFSYFLYLHWLIWTCLSVQSFIQPVVCSYSYLCGLKGGRRARLPPCGLGLGMLCDHFTKQFDPLFSLCCCGHSIWSVFLEAALSFLSIQQAQKKVFLTFQLTNPFTLWPIAFWCLAAWKWNIAPFQHCSFALLSLTVNGSKR